VLNATRVDFYASESMLWDRKGVFKDKKQKRYGSPTIQKYSSSHCGFLEFKNQESTRFQCVGEFSLTFLSNSYIVYNL